MITDELHTTNSCLLELQEIKKGDKTGACVCMAIRQVRLGCFTLAAILIHQPIIIASFHGTRKYMTHTFAKVRRMSSSAL